MMKRYRRVAAAMAAGAALMAGMAGCAEDSDEASSSNSSSSSAPAAEGEEGSAGSDSECARVRESELSAEDYFAQEVRDVRARYGDASSEHGLFSTWLSEQRREVEIDVSLGRTVAVEVHCDGEDVGFVLKDNGKEFGGGGCGLTNSSAIALPAYPIDATPTISIEIEDGTKFDAVIYQRDGETP